MSAYERKSSADLSVPTLGTASVRSPLKLSTIKGDRIYNFVDNERVLMDALAPVGHTSEVSEFNSFERAGPRELLFFDPGKLRVGIVTCGGLCPGINNAIRAATIELLDHYRVREVFGFLYGFAGLNPEEGLPPVRLSSQSVEGIHHDGGSILGSSRGPQQPNVVIDMLEEMGVQLLLVIGGDGTMRGTYALSEEISRRGSRIAVVGIPKSIDNDIPLVDKTFGYETAFSIAVESIRAAHTEAVAYRHGLGIVRLMGRHSGFIAASAAVAEADADFVLVPEVPIVLDGSNGFLDAVSARLQANGHVVVVVSEGAGQDLLQMAGEAVQRDESGNARLLDIGSHLKQRIAAALRLQSIQHTIKYIDPSYLIRSTTANPSDSVYSSDLARNAVHAGMAGRSGLLVGYWNGEYTHVPLREVVKQTRVIDVEGDLWHSVLECTGQPPLWGTG